jgi:hypothetical protein
MYDSTQRASLEKFSSLYESLCNYGTIVERVAWKLSEVPLLQVLAIE